MPEKPVFHLTDEQVTRVKASMSDAWNVAGAGYQEIAEGLRPAIEHLLDFLPVRSGMRVLDVATGTGLAAILAAERGASVTALDFAPDLLAEARKLAEEHNVSDRITFDHGDAENLPYEDASFDAVISTFGSMFVPRHDAVSFEMARVLKPGALLGLATWKPEGPNCRLMNITVPYLPPRTLELPSPLDWGRPEYVTTQLGRYVTDITHDEGNAPWRISTVPEALDMLFSRSLGPTIYAYRQFDDQTKLAVRADAIALMRDCMEEGGTINLRRDYLLTRGVRRG